MQRRERAGQACTGTHVADRSTSGARPQLLEEGSVPGAELTCGSCRAGTAAALPPWGWACRCRSGQVGGPCGTSAPPAAQKPGLSLATAAGIPWASLPPRGSPVAIAQQINGEDSVAGGAQCRRLVTEVVGVAAKAVLLRWRVARARGTSESRRIGCAQLCDRLEHGSDQQGWSRFDAAAAACKCRHAPPWLPHHAEDWRPALPAAALVADAVAARLIMPVPEAFQHSWTARQRPLLQMTDSAGSGANRRCCSCRSAGSIIPPLSCPERLLRSLEGSWVHFGAC